jgi:hypothetical protein
MSKASISTAREQALRDSLLVRYAAAAAAGNIDTRKALNYEATYLGIQLNKSDGHLKWLKEPRLSGRSKSALVATAGFLTLFTIKTSLLPILEKHLFSAQALGFNVSPMAPSRANRR